MATQHKALTWSGRILTSLLALGLTFSAIAKFSNSKEVAEQFVDTLGYPADLTVAIGIVEISCLVIYLIPQTAVLGAVLLTGYLGGAVATHVRVHDNFAGPVIGGVLVWLAVFLRDPRVRALLPLRRSPPPVESNSS
ncbi:MAG: DoxX family protein [Planctomycetia bacterium]|nr:DoxX family protein [Planctomycetia bacterium]